MKKLVFLGYLPLTEKYADYLSLGALASRGVPLEYWDLSPAYFPGLTLPGELDLHYARKFHSLAEVRAALAPQAGETFALLINAFEPRLLGLMRLLTELRVETGHLSVGLSPQPAGTRAEKLLANLRHFVSPSAIWNFAKYKACGLLRRSGYIKPFDVVFAAGEAAARIHAGAKAIIPVNHYDYDSALLNAAAEEPPVPGKYAVFLDEYLPHHQDFDLLGVKKIDPARYYAALNAFFAKLEAKHGVEVLIAAHPKADYKDNPFGGRKVFHGKSRLLVRCCEFAFAVASNSTGFAAIYEKPVFFVYTEEIREKYRSLKYDRYPFACAAAFGCKAYDLEAPGEAPEIPRVDAGKCAAYRREYQSANDGAGGLNADIIADYLKREAK